MVEFLVEHGADVNRGDNEGWTPLHATASCGFLSIARSFLLPVLWNRNYFLRFRFRFQFRLLPSYGSGSSFRFRIWTIKSTVF
jgi:ankyrin repeat protein